MNVLILGASSFIGVYCVNELLNSGNNYNIIGTGRNPKFKDYYYNLDIPYVNVDLNDPASYSALDKYEIDVVVLLAVKMPANVEKNDRDDDIADYYQVNAVGTCYLMEYCRKRGINKVITYGSRFDTRLYGQGAIITENTPLNFSYKDDHVGYVLTNISKQQILTYYNEKYGMQNIMFRIPSIFGLGPHGQFCKDGVYVKSGLQIFMEKAVKGETIEVFGDPNTEKDLFYVKDLAYATRLAIDSITAKGFYNIGYDRNFTLPEIANAIVEVFSDPLNKSQIILRKNVKNNGSFPLMDSSKVKKELGFRAKYSDIKDIMEDYKAEKKRGVYDKLFGVNL
ncbi:NAD-dependent epimerase/dehydratase family protein [Bacteroides uniformis]|uniref:NAD-dependent epimerase/dehydratase family protein n=1 Tax=Bacteroides uniformis TaxID=820 RepID=UPI001898A109|nr:NAD(P)-dependent oxidoreductase [Bacteroides uniformis]